MRPLVALALLLLAPLACAGSETNPEVDDSRDQEDPTADLLAAWLTSEPGGLRFTLKLANLQEPVEGRFHAVAFVHNGTRYVAGIGFDERGRPLTHVGEGLGRLPRAALDEWANGDVVAAKLVPGAPALVTGVIPWRAIPGLGAESRLTGLSAGVAERGGFGGWRDVDHQQAHSDHVVQRAYIPSQARAWLPETLLVLGVALVGAGAGVAAHRLRVRRDRQRYLRALRKVQEAAELPPTRRAARLRELRAEREALRLPELASEKLAGAEARAAVARPSKGRRFSLRP